MVSKVHETTPYVGESLGLEVAVLPMRMIREASKIATVDSQQVGGQISEEFVFNKNTVLPENLRTGYLDYNKRHLVGQLHSSVKLLDYEVMGKNKSGSRTPQREGNLLPSTSQTLKEVGDSNLNLFIGTYVERGIGLWMKGFLRYFPHVLMI